MEKKPTSLEELAENHKKKLAARFASQYDDRVFEYMQKGASLNEAMKGAGLDLIKSLK